MLLYFIGKRSLVTLKCLEDKKYLGEKMTRLVYVDYEKMRRKIEKLVKEEKNLKKKVEYQILLIQLVNGARISEAYDAYYQWVRDPERKELDIRVRKKRQPEYRKIYIPENIEPINIKVHINAIMRTCRRDLGVNTHSLRYAFITYLGIKHHLPPQVIAKLTKHSKPELVEYYTQELIAQQIHKKIVYGKK